MKISEIKHDEELLRLGQNGDKQATEELIRRYAELVRRCARGFFLIGGETEDLLQEGMIGLYSAIVGYQKDGGSSFKNFAYTCISRQIIDAVKATLEKTPPELAADVADRGIVLTGGGSLLRGLEELLESHTGINTMTAEDPMTCVAIGTGRYVEFLSERRERRGE